MRGQRDAELGGRLFGSVAPRLPVGARDERELRADEVERRDALPVAFEPDVGAADPGRGGRLVRALVGGAVVRRADHGARAIAVAEIDCRILDVRGEAVRAEARIEPRHVPHVRLLGRELAHGAPLRVVRVEQRVPGVALQHVCELPREVVRAVDSRVAAEAARRRHHVRSVAGDEHAALAEVLGPVRLRVPALDVLDLDRQVLRRAKRLADVLDALLGAGVIP